MKKITKIKAPLSFRNLKEIKYKAYSKIGISSFYNTKDYELFQFYKSISNL